MKKNILPLVLLPVIFLMPYNLLGQELGSLLTLLLGIVCIFINIKEIKINKLYISSLLLLVVAGFLSLIFSQNYTKTLSGIFIYLSMLIYYVIFSSTELETSKAVKWLVYPVIIASNLFIIYQGLVYKLRIDANIGYANTYALILLICICLLNIIEENKYFKDYLEFTAMLALIYTGSRTTLVYLFIYVVVMSVLQIKNKKSVSQLFNFILALVVYISLTHFGFGMLFVVPIVVFSIYYFTYKISYRGKNILTLCFMAVSILMLIVISTNLSQRLANFSINAGVLQERFVYYEDSIKHITAHPLGSGINTFEYKQYKDQSAFYDVRFIHNFLLQSGYDMGMLGILIFLFLACYGFKIIKKSSNPNRLWYLFMYLIIYVHSLLDFDFSYIPVLILLTLLVSFSDENKATISIKTKYYTGIPVLVFGLYLTVVNMNYFIGDQLLSSGSYKGARSLYKVNSSITFKDSDSYSKIAQCYNEQYRATKDKANLQNALDNLMRSYSINPYDDRVAGNIAFTYQAMGKNKEAAQYYDKFLKDVPYYLDMYKLYYTLLKDSYAETNDSYYQKKITDLKNYYEANQKNLNPKAKYMNDQITQNTNTIFK